MQNSANSDWLKEMAEAEIECGGIVSGRLGSPDDHPIEEVEEDEETLRQMLRDSLKEMLDMEAAAKMRVATLPDVLPPLGLSTSLIDQF